VGREGSLISSMTLGQSNDVLNNTSKSPLNELLTIIANDVIDDLRKKLDEYDANASSRLKQSLVVLPVETGSNEVSVSISADFYWKFVNYGVNGTEVNHGSQFSHRNPTGASGEISFKDSIKEWISFRGIQLPSQFSSYDSFAWAIRNKIRRDGTKPRPFYTDVVNEKLIKEIQEPIEALFGRAITINIIEPWQ